jgi:hypothetical protein
VLLDLREQCRLPESMAGWEAALARLGVRWARAESPPAARVSALVVPAALRIPPAATRAIDTCLDAGGYVILESGAGFADAGDFRAHQAVLRDQMQIAIEPPVPRWPADAHAHRIPYVDYVWPHPAKVRDFSRVVPLGHAEGDVIAHVDGLPAVLKQRRGRGTLIFLGSPLGPGLWAGDAEASRWLFGVLTLVSSILTAPAPQAKTLACGAGLRVNGWCGLTTPRERCYSPGRRRPC